MATILGSKYLLLHRSADAVDESDYVGLQTEPADLIEAARAMPSGNGGSLALEVVLRWIDTTPTPDVVDITDRGAASISFIRVMRYVPRVTGFASTIDIVETIVVGTTAAAVVANQPLILDEIMPGDLIGVRLTGMTPSVGAERAEVLYRWLQK